MGIRAVPAAAADDDSAAAAPAPPSPVLQPQTGGIGDVLSQITTLLPQVKALQGPAAQRAQDAIERNTATVTRLANEPSPPMPLRPQLQDLPQKPDFQFRETMQAFQSPAIALTILGSLLTRAPLTAALKAGAAAMQGFHQGDKELYEKNRADWKDNLDRAIQQNNLEIEKYREILDERKISVTEKMARINALAAANRDEQMVINAQNGLISNVFTILNHREAQQQRLENARSLAQFRQDSIAETKRRDAEAERRNKANEDLRAKTIEAVNNRAKAAQEKKQETADLKAKAKADELDTLTAQIDSVLGMVKDEEGASALDALSGKMPSTGASGFLQRLYNMTLGQVLPDIGKRREFEAKMNLLQTTLQNKYLNSKYFAKGAIEKMNELMPGLSATDSAKDTIEHLKNLREVVLQQIEDIKRGNVPADSSEQGPTSSGEFGNLTDQQLIEMLNSEIRGGGE